MNSSTIILIVLIILVVVVWWYLRGKRTGNYTFVSSKTIEQIFPQKREETPAPIESAPVPSAPPAADVSQEPLGDTSVV